jgi:hypothetical protein
MITVIFFYVSSTSVALGSEFYAQNNQKKSVYTVEDNPLPNGKPKIVGGIMTTAIGGGVGLLVLFLSIFNFCGSSDDAKSCRQDKRNQEYLGGGILLLSTGIGIPLIMFGASQRTEWKNWNKENVRGYSWRNDETEEASMTSSQQLSLLARKDAVQFSSGSLSNDKFHLRMPLVAYVF